jgi:hypothetical protein
LLSIFEQDRSIRNQGILRRPIVVKTFRILHRRGGAGRLLFVLKPKDAKRSRADKVTGQPAGFVGQIKNININAQTLAELNLDSFSL